MSITISTKLFLSAVLFWAPVIVPVFAAGEKTKTAKAESKIPANDYLLKNNDFSFAVAPSGVIRSCQAFGTVVVNEGLLCAAFIAKENKKGGGKFMQDADGGKLTINNSEPATEIAKEGMLRNSIDNPGAVYIENIKFYGNTAEFAYRIETRTALSSQNHVFYVMLLLPAETFAGRGCVINRNGVDEQLILPDSYAKENSKIKGFNSIGISLENSVVEFIGGTNASMQISDLRGEGRPLFMLNIFEYAAWKPKPEPFQPGHKFEIKFTIKARKF